MMKSEEAAGPGAEEEANFIAAVKRIREEQGWSQGELARRMAESGWEGFHQTTISRIEKGERPVRLGEARGLAKALGALVGQMILPPDESKTLRDLELAVMSVECSAKELARSAEELITNQTTLKHELAEASEVSIDGDMDAWIVERYSMVMEAANRVLKISPESVLRETMEAYYGIDPEEA